MQNLLKNPQFSFVAKLLLAYTLWVLLYELWILPNGRLDTWLSLHLAQINHQILTSLGFDAFVSGRIVWMPSTKGIEIINGCNGLEVIGLFAGFLFAYPGDHKKRALFFLLGIGIIYLTNVARLLSLSLIQYYNYSYFDIAHNFLAKGVFYLVVFSIWALWIKFGSASLSKTKAIKRTTAPHEA